MLDGPVSPMEPQSRTEPFDSPRHIFEVKWDGVRMIAFCKGGAVRLQNRRLHDRTLQYPELGELSRMLGSREAVMDGEVIAMRQGRPSFFAVMERDVCKDHQRVQSAMRTLPVTFMVFDLLSMDGRDLTPEPLETRKDELRRLLRSPGESVLDVESYPVRGKALYEATGDKGLEGIVAKEMSGPYLPGQKSALWLKVKHRKRQLCTVCGFVPGAGGAISILAGAVKHGTMLYVGSVSTGLKSRDVEALVPALLSMRVPGPPFPNPPGARDAVYVKPALTFLADFAEWTEDLKMRSPVFSGFTALAPEDCVMA
ncbi:MAG: non-homologous end-joining DNA ligase [Bacillota bacterium]|nr:non-homologous end-joining DNA ligase [Bacillota bacterium]